MFPDNDYRNYLMHTDQDMKYGLPEKKKYPMPDRDHVMSAIKFFNYVSPADEKELARNIIARIREYGITGINVGENNRFRKYYDPEDEVLEHHGILGQKWGVRRYQNSDGSLTSAGKTHYTAKQIHRQALSHEPRITADVENAVNASGSKMYGLNNRIKSLESISRKLDLGKDIRDAVRYTTISSEKNFVRNYEAIKSKLQQKGYTEIKCKNYFEDYKQGKVKHKSVQCNFRTNDGYTFEIQFHTKASQDAKTKKVPLYEEVRNPSVSDKRKAQIIKEMESLAESVRDPKDIDKIKSH